MTLITADARVRNTVHYRTGKVKKAFSVNGNPMTLPVELEDDALGYFEVEVSYYNHFDNEVPQFENWLSHQVKLDVRKPLKKKAMKKKVVKKKAAVKAVTYSPIDDPDFIGYDTHQNDIYLGDSVTFEYVAPGGQLYKGAGVAIEKVPTPAAIISNYRTRMLVKDSRQRIHNVSLDEVVFLDHAKKKVEAPMLKKAIAESHDAVKQSSFQRIGREVGDLVTEKNKAYGNSFRDCSHFLEILYPDGITPDKYADMLCVVRMFDKLKRIATKKDAFGESPYRDIAGYAILGIDKDENEKADSDVDAFDDL